MKKSSKRLILLGMTTSLIATSGIMRVIKPLKTTLPKKEIMRYNHNPVTALDNIFIEDGMTILPFIYSKTEQKMTKEIIEEEFRKAGLTIKSISTGNVIGTGTEITVNENSNTYTVLIYGDLDSNGEVDFYDALELISAVNNPETKNFKGIFFKAANLENTDNDIEFYDALRIISFVNEVEGAKILKVEPESLKEKDVIASIELGKAPTKLKYNYGETTVDLTGGTVKVNWQSGNTTYVSMDTLTTDPYDISSEGEHTITVNYEGQTVEFNVTVLSKISALELTATGRKDVIEVTGGYQTESNKEFNLGTIQAVNKDNVSALTADVVQIEIPEANKDVLTVEKVIDENGNITLKGKTTVDGIYTINVSISYGAQKVELPITIQAEKSKKISRIVLDKVSQNDLRTDKTVKINVDIININGEKIIPETITFENVPSGVSIAKFGEHGVLGDTESSQLKYIEVSTTLEDAGKVSFTIKATGEGTNNIATNTVSINVEAASYVNNVNIETPISLYTELKSGITVAEGTNIYTTQDISFTDQRNETMNLLASDIKITDPDRISDLTLQKGEVAIVVPKVTLKVKDRDRTIEGQGIYAKLYDENNNPATNDVAKLGVAIMTDNTSFDVVLSSIEGKKLKVLNYKKETIAEIPVQVVYNELEHMSISAEGRTANVILNTQTGTWTVPLNEEFILGTIEVGENEGPLTADMLTTPGISEGVSIVYELGASGKIIIKGTATVAGQYSISPKAGSVESLNSIIIEAKEAVVEENVTIDFAQELKIENGVNKVSTLTVKTDSNPDGIAIQSNDVELEYDTTKFTVTKMYSFGTGFAPIPDGQNRDVTALQIEGIATEDVDNATLKITVYKGTEKETSITTNLSSYNSIPRVIEVENTVTLNRNDRVAVTIKAWADAEKTKPVTLRKSMFAGIMDDADAANKIHITIPTVEGIRGGVKPSQVDAIKYDILNESKQVAGNDDEVKFIGFKIEYADIYTVPDENLNGVTITVKSTYENSEPEKTITTSYAAGN